MNIGIVVISISVSVVFTFLMYFLYRECFTFHFRNVSFLHKGERIHRRWTIILGSIASFVITVLLFFGIFFALHSWFKSWRESYIEDGLEARSYVQETLVKNCPELEGVDPKSVVFDDGDGVTMTVTAPTRVVVDDLFAYKLMENYFEEYSFDVRAKAEFQYFLTEAILSALATLIFGILVMGAYINPYDFFDDRLPDFNRDDENYANDGVN